MTRMVGCALATATALAVVVGACGGESPSQPGAGGIQVAGTYDTAVELAENTCSGISVASQPTMVAHGAGSTRVSLTHAGATYSGTLGTDGSFSTDPVSLPDGQGATSTVQISGRFTLTGFTATVT